MADFWKTGEVRGDHLILQVCESTKARTGNSRNTCDIMISSSLLGVGLFVQDLGHWRVWCDSTGREIGRTAVALKMMIYNQPLSDFELKMRPAFADIAPSPLTCRPGLEPFRTPFTSTLCACIYSCGMSRGGQ